jgi:sugar/nucleoside kinase (ribokinase family)
MNTTADLADIACRIAGADPHACRVVTGFDGFVDEMISLVGEANILCGLHDLPSAPAEATPDEALRQAAALREVLGISRVVVHRNSFAVSAAADGGFIQAGPYCPNPRKSTGAGDRFNAGFCLGLALLLADAEALALGCAAAGFFVRNARSATSQELLGFLHSWAAGSPAAAN